MRPVSYLMSDSITPKVLFAVQSVDYAKHMYDGMAASFPEPHMVLSHSTKSTSKPFTNVEYGL